MCDGSNDDDVTRCYECSVHVLSLRTESLAFCNTLRMIKSFFFVFCWLCFVVLFVLLLVLFLGIKGGD